MSSSRRCKPLFIACYLLAGRKSGKGMFLYENSKSKTREENPGALEILKKHSTPPRIEYVFRTSVYAHQQYVHFLELVSSVCL